MLSVTGAILLTPSSARRIVPPMRTTIFFAGYFTSSLFGVAAR
tara:strand:+ start:673 stop:801 length:129 start_codon:yes stop_codon:yes gene_type:complete